MTAETPGTPLTPERPRCSWCDRKVPRENHRPNCPRPDERYSAFDLEQARGERRERLVREAVTLDSTDPVSQMETLRAMTPERELRVLLDRATRDRQGRQDWIVRGPGVAAKVLADRERRERVDPDLESHYPVADGPVGSVLCSCGRYQFDGWTYPEEGLPPDFWQHTAGPPVERVDPDLRAGNVICGRTLATCQNEAGHPGDCWHPTAYPDGEARVGACSDVPDREPAGVNPGQGGLTGLAATERLLRPGGGY